MSTRFTTAERAWHAYMARDFETARIQSIDALDTQPGFPAAHFSLGLANEQLGRQQASYSRGSGAPVARRGEQWRVGPT